MIHSILHYFETGNGYQFWSGIGSCATYITGPILGLGAWYHKHNCAAHRCKKVGRFQHPAHGNHVCKRHLRDPHVLHEDGRVFNR